jgi:excisionase family DNA binding protein
MAKAKTSRDEQLSTVQVAAELGISKVRVIVLINEGRIPATRIGNIWVIRRGDLDAVRHRPTGRPRKEREEPKKPERKKKPG